MFSATRGTETKMPPRDDPDPSMKHPFLGDLDLDRRGILGHDPLMLDERRNCPTLNEAMNMTLASGLARPREAILAEFEVILDYVLSHGEYEVGDPKTAAYWRMIHVPDARSGFGLRLATIYTWGMPWRVGPEGIVLLSGGSVTAPPGTGAFASLAAERGMSFFRGVDAHTVYVEYVREFDRGSVFRPHEIWDPSAIGNRLGHLDGWFDYIIAEAQITSDLNRESERFRA